MEKTLLGQKYDNRINCKKAFIEFKKVKIIRVMYDGKNGQITKKLRLVE